MYLFRSFILHHHTPAGRLLSLSNQSLLFFHLPGWTLSACGLEPSFIPGLFTYATHGILPCPGLLSFSVPSMGSPISAIVFDPFVPVRLKHFPGAAVSTQDCPAFCDYPGRIFSFHQSRFAAPSQIQIRDCFTLFQSSSHTPEWVITPFQTLPQKSWYSFRGHKIISVSSSFWFVLPAVLPFPGLLHPAAAIGIPHICSLCALSMWGKIHSYSLPDGFDGLDSFLSCLIIHHLNIGA